MRGPLSKRKKSAKKSAEHEVRVAIGVVQHWFDGYDAKGKCEEQNIPRVTDLLFQ